MKTRQKPTSPILTAGDNDYTLHMIVAQNVARLIGDVTTNIHQMGVAIIVDVIENERITFEARDNAIYIKPRGQAEADWISNDFINHWAWMIELEIMRRLEQLADEKRSQEQANGSSV